MGLLQVSREEKFRQAIESQLYAIGAIETGQKIGLNDRLLHDLGVLGMDWDELLEGLLPHSSGVDWSQFDFSKYFPMEGELDGTPLSRFKWWRMRLERKYAPITIHQLIRTLIDKRFTASLQTKGNTKHTA